MEELNKNEFSFNLTTLFVALVGLIPFAYELLKYQDTNKIGSILLTSIFIVIGIYFIYIYLWRNVIDYKMQINLNNSRLVNLEKNINYKDDFYKLEKRLSLLEVFNEHKR